MRGARAARPRATRVRRAAAVGARGTRDAAAEPHRRTRSAPVPAAESRRRRTACRPGLQKLKSIFIVTQITLYFIHSRMEHVSNLVSAVILSPE